MMFLIILLGMVLGIIVFSFTFILSKKNQKHYWAPLITFIMSIGVVAYGLFFVGGFEGMAFGVLALGILIASIIGTLLLPFLIRRKSAHQFRKKDRIILVILFVVFMLLIGGMALPSKGYWIIDQGETNGNEEGYSVSTISEGRKEVLLMLGEEYIGKEVNVKKVTKRGATHIIVEIVEGENKHKAPYIRIGLDEIKEPLKIETTEGKTFNEIVKP